MAGSLGANSTRGANEAAQTALGLGGSDSAIASYQQSLAQLGNRVMAGGSSRDPSEAYRQGNTLDKPEATVSNDIIPYFQPYTRIFRGCTPVTQAPGSPPSGPGPSEPEDDNYPYV